MIDRHFGDAEERRRISMALSVRQETAGQIRAELRQVGFGPCLSKFFISGPAEKSLATAAASPAEFSALREDLEVVRSYARQLPKKSIGTIDECLLMSI